MNMHNRKAIWGRVSAGVDPWTATSFHQPSSSQNQGPAAGVLELWHHTAGMRTQAEGGNQREEQSNMDSTEK